MELANLHGYLQCYYEELRRIIDVTSESAWGWEVRSWKQNGQLLGIRDR